MIKTIVIAFAGLAILAVVLLGVYSVAEKEKGEQGVKGGSVQLNLK